MKTDKWNYSLAWANVIVYSVAMACIHHLDYGLRGVYLAILGAGFLSFLSLAVSMYVLRTRFSRPRINPQDIIVMCSHCCDIRFNTGDSTENWMDVSEYIELISEKVVSHGICPVCQQKHFPDEFRKEVEASTSSD